MSGVWGIIFVLVEPYLVRSPGGYWVGAIIFGAIFPTTVAWFIVRPLKGLPVADVFRVPGIFIGPIVNGLWGLGTALFLSWMPGSRSGLPAGGRWMPARPRGRPRTHRSR